MRIMLAGWVIITLVGLAVLSAGHEASLPEPEDEAKLSRAILQLRRGSMGNFVVHVIYAQCSCSRALFLHLVTRHPFPDAEEVILFAGADPRKEELAKQAGFGIMTVSAAELVSRFGIEAAPVLIVFDSAGRLRYAGGYYSHPATITPLDESIYARLAAGAEVEPLPVFGCAVSVRLQKSLDPLGL
ncbi:MAG TPA: hypothetical protein VGL53_13660, partial [Bryobacteraceae bacterium]